MGGEFVIHIPSEYDYRYSAFDKWYNKNNFISLFFLFIGEIKF